MCRHKKTEAAPMKNDAEWRKAAPLGDKTCCLTTQPLTGVAKSGTVYRLKLELQTKGK